MEFNSHAYKAVYRKCSKQIDCDVEAYSSDWRNSKGKKVKVAVRDSIEEYQKTVEQLSSIFPQFQESMVVLVLQQSGYNAEKAAEVLLDKSADLPMVETKQLAVDKETIKTMIIKEEKTQDEKSVSGEWEFVASDSDFESVLGEEFYFLSDDDSTAEGVTAKKELSYRKILLKNLTVKSNLEAPLRKSMQHCRHLQVKRQQNKHDEVKMPEDLGVDIGADVYYWQERDLQFTGKNNPKFGRK